MNAEVLNWEAVPAQPGRWRRWAPWLALAVLTAVGAQSYLGAGPLLNRLDIQGDFQQVLPREVHAAAEPFLRVGFFELELDAVRNAVEADPWVERALVDRSWPNAVNVRVWEHRAYARWSDSQLLSDRGVLFSPEELPAGLPQLGGPDGQQQRVREVWEALAFALERTPFALSGLQLGARDNWVATTRSGVELRLGRGDPLQRLPTLLGPAQTALSDALTRVAHIDLRYANGFSVGWRPDEQAMEDSNG